MILSSSNFFSMTNEKIIIGLVGQMASGKGTIAEYLRDKHGADFLTTEVYSGELEV